MFIIRRKFTVRHKIYFSCFRTYSLSETGGHVTPSINYIKLGVEPLYPSLFVIVKSLTFYFGRDDCSSFRHTSIRTLTSEGLRLVHLIGSLLLKRLRGISFINRIPIKSSQVYTHVRGIVDDVTGEKLSLN